MTTLIEAKAKVRQLSQKALDIVESPSLTNPQKKTALDKIEPDIKHWTDEVQALEQFEAAKRGALGGFGLSNLGDLHPGGSNGPGDAPRGVPLYGQKTLAGPPSIQFDQEDAHQLFMEQRGHGPGAGPAGVPGPAG